MRAVAGTQRDLGWTQAERAAGTSRALLDWYDRERRNLPGQLTFEVGRDVGRDEGGPDRARDMDRRG